MQTAGKASSHYVLSPSIDTNASLVEGDDRRAKMLALAKECSSPELEPASPTSSEQQKARSASILSIPRFRQEQDARRVGTKESIAENAQEVKLTPIEIERLLQLA